MKTRQTGRTASSCWTSLGITSTSAFRGTSVPNQSQNSAPSSRVRLLTTAAGLANHTLVRLQKGGRGKWTNGEVKWIDYQANLAIIGVKDDEFWEGLKTIKFADANGLKEDLQVIRWRGGNIEKRAAEFSRFTVADANFNQAPRIELKASSEIEGSGPSRTHGCEKPGCWTCRQ